MYTYKKRSLLICTLHEALLGWPNVGQWAGQGVWKTWETQKTHVEVEKYESNCPLRRPCRGMEDNVEDDLK
jgi:hypothetical protein